MSDSPTSPFLFHTLAPLALESAFDGGQLTSDGGLLWIAAASPTGDAKPVCIPFSCSSVNASTMPPKGHPACGFEDQNDATTLRHDPLLKLVCGRLPESGAPLASQPTFSRLENAVSARDCYRIARALGMVSLRERGKDGPPRRILLD